MSLWHSITVYFSDARLRSSDTWRMLRCGLVASLVVLMSGCSWLLPAPQPEPEREAVQEVSVAHVPARTQRPPLLKTDPTSRASAG